MYSTHNEGKSVLAERYIKTLNNQIYTYMTSVSKNLYIDRLADIINIYNNTYYSTIKMKHVDAKSSTSTDFNVEKHDEYLTFKVDDHGRILKYKKNFAKIYEKLNLSNYARKSDLRSAKEVDTSKFAKKIVLASLRSEIDKLDIDELETTPVNGSKLSGIVKTEVVKKTIYNELVEKRTAIDASGLVKNRLW